MSEYDKLCFNMNKIKNLVSEHLMESKDYQRIEKKIEGTKVILEFPIKSCQGSQIKQDIKNILINEIQTKMRDSVYEE